MDAARKKPDDLAPDEEHLPEDLLHLKRAMEARGLRVRLPRPGAKWIDREPIDFGVSVSDIVIRNRGGDPDAPAPLPIVSCEECRTRVSVERAPSDREIPDEEYPPDLLELKRNAARHGVTLRLPKPGAKWIDREPIDFGVSVSDIVIRNRGKVP